MRNGIATLSCVSAEAKVQETLAESADVTGHQLQELRSELLLVTQERDDYKRQCQVFTDQIQVLQQRLLEINNK